MLKQAHLQFAQANRTKPKLQKSLLCQRTTTQQKWTDKQHTEKKGEQLTRVAVAQLLFLENSFQKHIF